MTKKTLEDAAEAMAAPTAAKKAVSRYTDPDAYINRRAGTVTRLPVAPAPSDPFFKYCSQIHIPAYESKSTATNIRLQPSLKATFTAFCRERGFSFAEGVAAAMRCFMDVAGYAPIENRQE